MEQQITGASFQNCTSELCSSMFVLGPACYLSVYMALMGVLFR